MPIVNIRYLLIYKQLIITKSGSNVTLGIYIPLTKKKYWFLNISLLSIVC